MIKEELGSGTFGSVYLANFNIAGEPRCVVVKNPKVNQGNQSDALKKKLGFWTALKVIKILPGFCAFSKSPRRS